jgi:hypothetical protein
MRPSTSQAAVPYSMTPPMAWDDKGLSSLTNSSVTTRAHDYNRYSSELSNEFSDLQLVDVTSSSEFERYGRNFTSYVFLMMKMTDFPWTLIQ